MTKHAKATVVAGEALLCPPTVTQRGRSVDKPTSLVFISQWMGGAEVESGTVARNPGSYDGPSLTQASLLSKPLTSPLRAWGFFQVLLRVHQLSPEASNSLPSKDRGKRETAGLQHPPTHTHTYNASSPACWEVTAF